MRIVKGLITAAGDRERRIPLQTLVDRDGVTRTVLAMVVNEVVSAGVDEVCIVIPRGERESYGSAVPEHSGRLTFIEQENNFGYAGAIWSARSHLEDGPFLHLVGDHVYISGLTRDGSRAGWAARLADVAAAEDCAVSALQPTHESLIHRFGVIGGTPVSSQQSLYKVDTVIEKPNPTLAEQNLIVPGLRAGYYLAFFGMHVFTPALLEILGEQIQSQPESASVSGALHQLAARERYLGWQVTAHRYDLGPRYGLLNAQLALALNGDDRDEVLSGLAGLLAAHAAPAGKSESVAQ